MYYATRRALIRCMLRCSRKNIVGFNYQRAHRMTSLSSVNFWFKLILLDKMWDEGFTTHLNDIWIFLKDKGRVCRWEKDCTPRKRRKELLDLHIHLIVFMIVLHMIVPLYEPISNNWTRPYALVFIEIFIARFWIALNSLKMIPILTSIWVITAGITKLSFDLVGLLNQDELKRNTQISTIECPATTKPLLPLSRIYLLLISLKLGDSSLDSIQKEKWQNIGVQLETHVPIIYIFMANVQAKLLPTSTSHSYPNTELRQLSSFHCPSSPCLLGSIFLIQSI